MQVINQRKGRWNTFLGELEVQEFGQPLQPLAVALNGMSSKEEVIHEWDAVAVRLSGIGYHVLVPNWHSNPRTTPGVIGLKDLASVMRELMRAACVDNVTLFLGKSWGGGMAASLATDASFQVQQLVLVAPAGLSDSKPWQVTCRTALFWAQDDPIIPISTAKRIPGLLHHTDLFHEEH